MTKYVAVAGKGGTGKTTFTALLLRQLVKSKQKISILAVDADPNANLGEALGLPVTATISEILDDTRNPQAIPAGMTKDIYVEYKMQQSLVESAEIDLLVMGGPQGAGCYCYANDLLRRHLENLGKNYDFVTVDTEAGLEHISRRTIAHVDLMFVVSDSSVRGIRSAGRVYDLIKGLKSEINQVYLVVTKTVAGSTASLAPEISQTGLEVIGDIPLDPLIIKQDLAGLPIFDLPAEALAVQAVDKIIRQAGLL
ncbi:MAG: AAA family ATPase [Desulfitobacteriaceae bacterium]|nr:AAA family ATPase [Desulfitobacteriaceae bacterium]MDD4346295.1 AAA family ATPase [Desulfitobacteriaceae bacterium]